MKFEKYVNSIGRAALFWTGLGLSQIAGYTAPLNDFPERLSDESIVKYASDADNGMKITEQGLAVYLSCAAMSYFARSGSKREESEGNEFR